MKSSKYLLPALAALALMVACSDSEREGDSDSVSPLPSGLIGQWIVESIGDEPLLPGSTVTISFLEEDQRVSGHAGCNHYSGEYHFEDGRMHFTPLTSTLMACADDAVTRQESRFLELMAQVSAVNVEGDQARLIAGDQSIRVVRAVD